LYIGVTISQTDEKMDIPVDEFDGKVTYGEKRKQESMKIFSNLIRSFSNFIYFSSNFERSC